MNSVVTNFKNQLEFGSIENFKYLTCLNNNQQDFV
jgi:hypothetical protein